MMNNSAEYSLGTILSKNRAEELGYDVWKHFVIPWFYKELDLQTATKPRLIIGGRGCGKTMLLRYLSHQSMFSPDREIIPQGATSHIGLFWRTDTNFASLMTGRGISEDDWNAAFAHLAAVLLGIEVLKSLKSIASSSSDALSVADVAALDFSRLRAFDSEIPASTESLHDNLEDRLWQFESWVSNVGKVSAPFFLPGDKFVRGLIEQISEQLPVLRSACFYVYVDEYENLQTYQQRVINAWLKHSEPPLIFNIAMKRNAFETLETTGPESLSDIHDFRRYDLEDYILHDKAGVFFAEIVLLELAIAGVEESPINISDLRDPEKLGARQNQEYTTKVLSAIQRILPDVAHKDLAAQVFNDKVLLEKLRGNIQKALRTRNSDISAECFLIPEQPEASIIAPALIFRQRNTPEKVYSELNKLLEGEKNSFTGESNWIHNNFVASLLQLYEPFNRACPFYAGFRTFISLSRGNIRHFLELCHKSFERLAMETNKGFGTIEPKLQAEAARQTSTAFLGEIRSFGPRGNNLHTFVLRLGSIFALSHQRPTLSENEQSHFAILAGTSELSTEDIDFLREAVKWSVLFEEKETKTKDGLNPMTIDYVLNPIYAPYFHISYRKKRKLPLSTDEVICLIRGSYDEVVSLIRDYTKRWQVDSVESVPTLFSHISIES